MSGSVRDPRGSFRMSARTSLSIERPEPTVSESADLEPLFQRIRGGDPQAEEELFLCVHGELRRMARGMMRAAPSHTLQPTALVNEVYLRLRAHLAPCRDRKHFLGVAARAMRQILVDHHRRKRASKRAALGDRVDLAELVDAFEVRSIDLLALDQALDRLAEHDPRLAELVHLHFFGGQTMEECAELLGISSRQATRWNTLAKAWLRREMQA